MDLHTLDPPLSPASRPVEFCWHTCLGEGKFFEKLPDQLSRHFRQFVFQQQPKKSPHLGGMSPKNVYPKYYFFLDLKLLAKFQMPRTTPSGRKLCGTEKQERKNNHKNSVHFVHLQPPRAVHALRSDQNISMYEANV
jgi:hypothetical protein